MLDLLGESAGGYLAAAVDVFSEKPQFRRVILANPITDLTLDCWGRFTQKGMKAAAFSPALVCWQAMQSNTPVHGEADTTVSTRTFDPLLCSNAGCWHPVRFVVFERYHTRFFACRVLQRYVGLRNGD